MVHRWRIFGEFLHPVFSASHMRHISDLHSKFALRPHHVWKYGRHPIRDHWEQARKKEERNHSCRIQWPTLLDSHSMNSIYVQLLDFVETVSSILLAVWPFVAY